MKWFIGVIVIIFVLIFVGWGISTIAQNLFGSDSGVSTEQVEDSLIDTVNRVSYTTDGPVVASSEHRSFTIEVSRNVVTMNVYSDYGQQILSSKSYTNNDTAYDALLQSLRVADATDRVQGTTEEDDYMDVGECPKGKRFILEIGDDIRRWDASCKSVDGTAGFSMSTVRTLFEKQIPPEDFKELTNDTGLRT